MEHIMDVSEQEGAPYDTTYCLEDTKAVLAAAPLSLRGILNYDHVIGAEGLKVCQHQHITSRYISPPPMGESTGRAVQFDQIPWDFNRLDRNIIAVDFVGREIRVQGSNIPPFSTVHSSRPQTGKKMTGGFRTHSFRAELTA